MGRPKKPDHEKLVPVSTHLDADTFDALSRIAHAKRTCLSVLIRGLIMRGLENPKAQAQINPATL